MYLKRDEHFNHLNSHYCEDSSTSYKTTSSDLRAKLQTKCLEIKKENKIKDETEGNENEMFGEKSKVWEREKLPYL